MNPPNISTETDTQPRSGYVDTSQAKDPAFEVIESPHKPQSYHKPQFQLLEKETLIGPVTAVTILTIPTVEDDNNERQNSFCVICRGPWVEMFPLYAEIPKHKKYHHFAFGRGNDESGSVHGIRHAFLTEEAGGALNSERNELSTIWLFFGGRKLSFATSNGVPGTTNDLKDIFLPIYIASEEEVSSAERPDKQLNGSSYLTVSDWIWDARILPLSCDTCCIQEASARGRTENEDCIPFDQATPLRILVAMGLAHNIVEIWSLHETSSAVDSIKGDTDGANQGCCTVKPTRLRKLICNVRCITYSLSLFGWKQDHSFITSPSKFVGEDLELAVAVGTVSNQILIWNVLDKAGGESVLNDEDAKFRKLTGDLNSAEQPEESALNVQFKAVSHTLSGHEGVIFSCKFGKGGAYLASTSDDRTIRLWKQAGGGICNASNEGTSFNSRFETSIQAKAVSNNEQNSYNLVWTGYGHIARVWDCEFLSLPLTCCETMQNKSSNEDGGIVSTGEDGTIRVWSIDRGIEVVTLEGHTCQSIWKVNSTVLQSDGMEGYKKHIIVTGANDGTAKLWDLDYHMKNNAVTNIDCTESCVGPSKMRTFIIPDDNGSSTLEKSNDDVPSLTAVSKGIQKSIKSIAGNNNNNDGEKTKKIKTKKKSKNPKFVGQIICGMNFYPKSSGGSRLLLTTRAGMLCTLSLKTGIWQMHSSWADQIVHKNVKLRTDEVDPSNGSCTAMHTRQLIIAVGTTKGQIVLASIRDITNDVPSTRSCISFIIPASNYLAIQGLKWLDDQNLLAFHIKGIVVWWTFEQDFSSGKLPDILQSTNRPYIKCILSMNVSNVTVGVPMSYLHDSSRAILFIGDSRGNIGLFDLIKEEQEVAETNSVDILEQLPVDILTCVHKKEHVNCIIPTSDGRGILSVGNDGRIQECTLRINDNCRPLGLRKAISRPVFNLSGPNRLWCVKHADGKSESIIAGGFHGNNFIIYDLTFGYQLLRVDTGGRQRRYDLSLDFAPSFPHSFPTHHELAICVAVKGGPSKIIVHSNLNCSSKIHLERPLQSLQYSIGSPCHGETILDVAFCKTSIPGSLLLLSGSNDCTVKLSLVQNGSIHTIKELPPHESCIRALCSSSHCGSVSSLLVVGGGKMSLTFYRVDEIGVKESMRSMSADNFSMHLLCRSKLSFRPSIDHRINAVKALPLLQHGCTMGHSHLVLSGDSNGGLHLTVVKETLSQQRHVVTSTTLIQDARPILSIEVVRISDYHILACVGDTAGNVSIWVLPGLLEDGEEGFRTKKHAFYGIIPTEPLHVYKGHQMGTNCVTMSIVGDSNKDSMKHINVLVGSGGDDQSIALFLLDISFSFQLSEHESPIVNLCASILLKEASSSALKGIHVTGDDLKGYRLYTVGYDQRMALWNLNISELRKKSRNSVTFLSSTAIDTFDVNCLDCYEITTDDGNSTEILVAGGEGIELLSLNSNSFRAAYALSRSNYLLITCGAGFSADSGISTYEAMPKDYTYLCNPLRLIDDRENFNNFWLRCAETYTLTKPHSGYTVIESWCHGGMLKNLGAQMNTCFDKAQVSPWWIYSSNVDGHFNRCQGFADTICEIHGRAREWRCANATGYSEETRRSGELWNKWNTEVDKTRITQRCRCDTFVADSTDSKRKNTPMLCHHCLLPVRPNVLMFNDTDKNILADINMQRDRYQKWESIVEGDVTNGRHLVILELGAGKNIPAVRDESEEVLSDCHARLSGQYNGGSVTCIRINPKDAGFKYGNSDALSSKTISIYDKAEPALSQINKWVRILGHGGTYN